MTSSPQISSGRKRSYRMSTFLVASAVALSFPAASAFQNRILHLPTGSLGAGRSACSDAHSSSHQPSIPVTQLHVVTDPNEIISMEIPDSDGLARKTIEEMYRLQTLDSDGLMGDMIEGDPSQRFNRSTVRGKKSKVKIRRSLATAASSLSPPQCDNGEEARNIATPRRVQFRGLSTTPSTRSKSKRASLSKSMPTPNSSKPIGGVTKDPNHHSPSKSSTMPGFAKSEFRSDNQKAFNDGIRMAESRSGRKLLESEEVKKRRREEQGQTMYKTSSSVPDSLVHFANEIHEVERITPKEEITLGELTQEAIRIQKVYNGLENQLQREPTDEEWCAASGKINMEALSQAIEDGLEAKNKLVTSNLRMVQGVVNVYIRNGLRGQYNAGDLMQEGILALIRAAEKFDPTRGFRFSTYAMYWIRSAIKRDQIFQSRSVTVPQRHYDTRKKVNRIKKELTRSFGRPPTKDELCAASGLSEMQLDRCLEAMSQRTYSLDQQIANTRKPMSGDKKGDTIHDLLESKTQDEDYCKQRHSFLREDLINTLRLHLNEEEVELLLLRYGLSENPSAREKSCLKTGPLTIAEVSRMAGLKPDKVRRILDRSLKHMKAVIGEEWYEYEQELQ